MQINGSYTMFVARCGRTYCLTDERQSDIAKLSSNKPTVSEILRIRYQKPGRKYVVYEQLNVRSKN